MTTAEFLHYWESRPEIKKVELIDGKVHRPSPLRADVHSEPDGLLHLLLSHYLGDSIGHSQATNPAVAIAFG